MCGIAGVLHLKGESPSTLRHVVENMTQALSHRGPDGSGVMVWDGVGIGHRRLSIIDLEAGKQPLANEDQTVWITFNGEIYNYLELRKTLEQSGHIFRTHSDTEVIVHAYEEWGEQCVVKFRGMFAFAITDLRKRCLFLARDHLGIKPLYYLRAGPWIAFASEIQAFRQLPDVPLELDIQALDHYLWLQYIPAPGSIFKQVRKLPPAHTLKISFAGEVSEPVEYWQLHFEPNHKLSEQDFLEQLDSMLAESVKAHLVADVPFGAFLSGGVDSSATVAYMAQVLKEPVRTFSIGFEEEEYNELPYAEIAARKWQTQHHVEIVRPNALEILPLLVRHYGEPFGDSSAIPTYYVCQLARKHVPMVLSGDGGDESFAGYHSYREWLKFLSLAGFPEWKKHLYPFASALLPDRYPPRTPTWENWLLFMQHMPTALRSRLWKTDYRSVVDLPLELFIKEAKRASTYGNAHRVQYLDFKTYLPFDILTKVDVASMAHGLEVRTPIVDVRVAEFAATIPESMNIRSNSQGQLEGKWLFKKLLQKYYSPDFLNRRKMGFGVPIDRWFGKRGELKKVVESRLLDPKARIREYFQGPVIDQIVAGNDSRFVWLLLFLEEWLHQHQGMVNKS